MIPAPVTKPSVTADVTTTYLRLLPGTTELLTSARRKRARKARPLATFIAVLLGVVVCVCPRCLRASSQGR